MILGCFDLDDMIKEETEDEKEEKFKIETASRADWAIRKVKEMRKRRDIYNEAAQEEIEILKEKIKSNNEKCEKETGYYLRALDGYMEHLPTVKAKTQESFSFPNGRLVRKYAKSVLQPNKEKILKYLEKEKDYIRVKKELDWDKFKKLLEVQNGKVVRKDTGEILDCVTAEEKPEILDIIFPEGEKE